MPHSTTGRGLGRIVIAAAVTFILVGAVMSGCGGGGSGGGTVVSQAEYEERIDAFASDLFGWFSDLRQISFYAPDLDEAGRHEAAGQIELIQERMRGEANLLEGLVPPEDAEAAHDELIDALRSYAGELDGFMDTPIGDPSPSFVEASQKIADVAETFETLGYAPWLTEERASPHCSSRATASWPQGPWCTE